MDFVKNVERFVDLHTTILDANKSMKEHKKEKASLGKEILGYMVSHHMDTYDAGKFVITNKEMERKEKLSVDFVEGMLEHLIGDTLDQEKLDRIISALLESERSGETKNVLSVKKLKESKKT